LDAISEALAGMIRRQRENDARLLRIESRLQRIEAALGQRLLEPVEEVPERFRETTAPASADFPAAAGDLHEASPVPAPPPPPPPPTATPPPLPAYIPPAQATDSGARAQEASFETSLETTFGLTWLNRVAAVTLVMGVAFFFKLAVDNQWIGPGMRVALGIAAAMAALSAGEWMSLRGQTIFARGVTGMGLGLLYLSFYATFGFYHLLPQSVAFLLMALTTVAAGALSLHYNSRAVAVLGMLGGYLTPALLSTGENRPWTLFGYLFLLNAGALTVARVRSWLLLSYIAFFATGLYYAGWASQWLNDDVRVVATVAALAFYVQFALTESHVLSQAGQVLAAFGMLGIWRAPSVGLPLAWSVAVSGLAAADWRKWPQSPVITASAFWIPIWMYWRSRAWDESQGLVFTWFTLGFVIFFAWAPGWIHFRRREVRSAELWVLAANGVVYFASSYALLNGDHHEWMGVLAAVLALLYAALAKFLWKSGEGRDSFAGRLAVGIAAVFVTLALPIQFTGFRITIAWAIEAAVCAWLARRLANDRLQFGTGILLMLVLFRLLAVDSSAHADNFFNARLLTFAVSAASFLFTARCLTSRQGMAVTYCGGHLLLLWGLVLEVAGWADRNAAPQDIANTTTTGISILIAIYALALVGAGVAQRVSINRLLGLALLGAVIAKLYLIDVWALSRGFRIVAFLALGAMLLLVSYLYSRFKPAIEKLWKDPGEETPTPPAMPANAGHDNEGRVP